MVLLGCILYSYQENECFECRIGISIIFFITVMKDSKSSLKSIRVLKKNMLFVQWYEDGPSKSSINQQELYELCGEVEKIKLKENYKNLTAYVSYSNSQAAATAFVGFYHTPHRVKVLFGTVQYCKFFIRKAECRNQHCVFLHVRDRKNQIIVNDQIEESAYQQHYQMALKMLEDQAFETFTQVLVKAQNISSPLASGMRKAADILLRSHGLKLEPPPPQRKSSQLVQSVSTNEQTLSEQRPASQRTSKIAEVTLDPQSKVEAQKNHTDSSPVKQGVNSSGDYLNIRIIKKLVRESTSKLYSGTEINRQQIEQRSKFILYKIVKK